MTQTVEVADIEKTHKNAIAELVQTACKFESHIEIESEGKNINAKSTKERFRCRCDQCT